jgi:hypothetical protein
MSNVEGRNSIDYEIPLDPPLEKGEDANDPEGRVTGDGILTILTTINPSTQ